MNAVGSGPEERLGVLRIGLLLLGLAAFLHVLAAWAEMDHPWSVPGLGRLASGLLGLTGVVLMARGLAFWPSSVTWAEVSDRLQAIESAFVASTAQQSTAEARSAALAEFRLALEEFRWDVAARLAERIRVDHPESPEVERLADELESSRAGRREQLRGQLASARGVGDADGVLTLRQELAALVSTEDRKDLDRETLAWLMNLLQKRLRAGTVRADVASLAARAAESFGDTMEGASLRASLPTLRRSAGLCPRCARPYAGLGDACPDCVQGAAPAP